MANKKISKKILEEAVQSLIKEGPLDNLSSMASGIVGGLKNIGQTTMGNYRLGQVDSQMKQFGKKTLKQWDVNKNQAEKSADKMAKSKNQNVAQTGKQIQQTLSSADNHIKQAVDTLQTAVPKAMLNVPGLDQNEINKDAVRKQFANPEVQKMLDAEFEKRQSLFPKHEDGDFENFVKQHYDGNPKQMTDKQMAAWFRTFLTSKKKQSVEKMARDLEPKQEEPVKKQVQPPPLPPAAKKQTPPGLPSPKASSNVLAAMSPEEKEEFKSKSLDIEMPPQKKKMSVLSQGSKMTPPEEVEQPIPLTKQKSIMPAVNLIKDIPGEAQQYLQKYLKTRSSKDLQMYLDLVADKTKDVSQTNPVDDTIISPKKLKAKKDK